jgi:hypothetical protein
MMNPCGGQQIINFPSSHRLKPVQHIDSIQFFPGSPQVSVGAAIERQGAEFFRLASLNEPCGMDSIIQVPQYPVINNCNCPDSPPGTFDVAVTPDGHHAFVANEYGLMPSPTPTTEKGGGNHRRHQGGTRRCWWIYAWNKVNRAKQHHIYTGRRHYSGNNYVA